MQCCTEVGNNIASRCTLNPREKICSACDNLCYYYIYYGL